MRDTDTVHETIVFLVHAIHVLVGLVVQSLTLAFSTALFLDSGTVPIKG